MSLEKEIGWRRPQKKDPLLRVIDRLPYGERKVVYDSFHPPEKPEYFAIFMRKQKRWLDKHKYFLGIDLAKQNQDSSKKATEQALTHEMIYGTPEGSSENVRFRLYWAAVCRTTIETPYKTPLEEFLKSIDNSQVPQLIL